MSDDNGLAQEEVQEIITKAAKDMRDEKDARERLFLQNMHALARELRIDVRAEIISHGQTAIAQIVVEAK